jgi:hypothetical protein
MMTAANEVPVVSNEARRGEGVAVPRLAFRRNFRRYRRVACFPPAYRTHRLLSLFVVPPIFVKRNDAMTDWALLIAWHFKGLNFCCRNRFNHDRLLIRVGAIPMGYVVLKRAHFLCQLVATLPNPTLVKCIFALRHSFTTFGTKAS